MTDDAIRRGKRAEQILNDEVFKEAVKSLRDDAIDQFKRCPITDAQGLLAARLRLDVIEALVVDLADAMRDGRFEQRKKEKPPVPQYVPRHSNFTM